MNFKRKTTSNKGKEKKTFPTKESGWPGTVLVCFSFSGITKCFEMGESKRAGNKWKDGYFDAFDYGWSRDEPFKSHCIGLPPNRIIFLKMWYNWLYSRRFVHTTWCRRLGDGWWDNDDGVRCREGNKGKLWIEQVRERERRETDGQTRRERWENVMEMRWNCCRVGGFLSCSCRSRLCR